MLGLLIAIGAGAITPFLDGPVARPLAQAMADTIELAEPELRTLSFMIAMIIAAILCAIVSSGSPLTLAIGGMIGFFGLRLMRLAQRMIENRST